MNALYSALNSSAHNKGERRFYRAFIVLMTRPQRPRRISAREPTANALPIQHSKKAITFMIWCHEHTFVEDIEEDEARENQN